MLLLLWPQGTRAVSRNQPSAASHVQLLGVLLVPYGGVRSGLRGGGSVGGFWSLKQAFSNQTDAASVLIT